MAFPGRFADRLALLILLGWIGYAALGPNVFGDRPWPDAVVDYHLIYEFSHHIVAKKKYPVKHAHPPPAIVLQYALAQPRFGVAAAVHMGLTIVAAACCSWTLLRLTRLDSRPGGMVLGLIAFAASSYYWCWDLRMQNSNLLFLAPLLLGAAALSGQRCGWAGFGFALSVSLKLFSVLVVPYLAWRRHWRALGWTTAWLVLLWIGLPAATFGINGMLEVYADWRRQMGALGGGGADLRHPILTSLQNSAAWMTEGDPAAMRRIVLPIQALWLALGLFGAATCLRRRDLPGDAYGMLADISLLILGPVAVSPYLEPYHPVAFGITTFLLVAAAFDPRQSARLRGLALAGLIAAVVVAKIPSPWPLRGLVINLQLLVGATAVAVIAWLRCGDAGVAAAAMPPVDAATAARRAA